MAKTNFDINPFALPATNIPPPQKSNTRLRRTTQHEPIRPYSTEYAIAEIGFRKARQKKEEEREHLHTINDIYKFLQKYLQELQKKLTADEKEQKDTSRLKTRIAKIEKACVGEYTCDPYQYEPELFEMLNHEKTHSADPEKINELRGLIRAGSWMTYERMKPAAVIELINKLKTLETEGKNFLMRRADPDTYKELNQNLKETLDELELIATSLRLNKTGDELEEAARIMEDLSTKAWSMLRLTMDQHQISLQDTQSHALTNPLIKEIETLGPVRDLVYFRRIYPKWAAETLRGN